MAALEFPGLRDHIIQHVQFKRVIADYHMRFLEGSFMVGADMLAYLQNWLVDHILHEDMKYKAFATAIPKFNNKDFSNVRAELN